MSDEAKNSERWMVATAAALRSLTAYFPVKDVAERQRAGNPGRLSSVLFPCQKNDENRCEGWTFVSSRAGLGAQGATPCPCARGQSIVLLPLLELAAEFREEWSPPHPHGAPGLLAFRQVANGADLKFHTLSWMHWAACSDFPAQHNTDWITKFVELSLNVHQRQTLRWWARLIELNQLIHNQVFTIVTRRGLQNLHRRGEWVAMAEEFRQLRITEQSLVVLCMTGDELKATGQHSQLNAWFDSFLSCIDESCAGLCLIAPQPLIENTESDHSASQSFGQEFRWKARPIQRERLPSFESILRRGSWDRLIEAQARGEHLLKARLAQSAQRNSIW